MVALHHGNMKTQQVFAFTREFPFPPGNTLELSQNVFRQHAALNFTLSSSCSLAGTQWISLDTNHTQIHETDGGQIKCHIMECNSKTTDIWASLAVWCIKVTLLLLLLLILLFWKVQLWLIYTEKMSSIIFFPAKMFLSAHRAATKGLKTKYVRA